jgi:hypothetical protein
MTDVRGSSVVANVWFIAAPVQQQTYSPRQGEGNSVIARSAATWQSMQPTAELFEMPQQIANPHSGLPRALWALAMTRSSQGAGEGIGKRCAASLPLSPVRDRSAPEGREKKQHTPIKKRNYFTLSACFLHFRASLPIVRSGNVCYCACVSWPRVDPPILLPAPCSTRRRSMWGA